MIRTVRLVWQVSGSVPPLGPSPFKPMSNAVGCVRFGFFGRPILSRIPKRPTKRSARSSGPLQTE